MDRLIKRCGRTNTMIHSIAQFLDRDDGATSVEYAVMLGLIIVVCIGAVAMVGGETSDLWDGNSSSVSDSFTSAGVGQ